MTAKKLVRPVEFCCYHVYKLRYTLFQIYIKFQAKICNISPTQTSSCTNICLIMLFDAKDVRIPLEFHVSSICNVTFKCFRFHVRHFHFQLNSHRFVHRAMLLWAAVNTQKQTQQRWICFQSWFTSFDSMVTKFITFLQKNHPHHLHFQWLSLITDWTVSKFSTSLHHALMALIIRRSSMENSDGQLRY